MLHNPNTSPHRDPSLDQFELLDQEIDQAVRDIERQASLLWFMTLAQTIIICALFLGLVAWFAIK